MASKNRHVIITKKGSYSKDYHQRKWSSPKERRLSSPPPRDSYDDFREDSNRHNSYNSDYDRDRDDYSNQQSSHSESSYSKVDVKKRAFIDATILITTGHLRGYAEQIERRLRNLNMNTEIRNMPDALLQDQVVEEIANEGVFYVIIVNSQNEAYHSLTLHIFQGTPQEHRNMPSDDAMSLVARNFERYLQVLKEKNAGHAATAAPSPSPPSPSQSVTPPLTENLPPSCPTPEPNLTSPHQQGLPFLPPSAEIRYLLDLLADSRYLTLEELDKVLDYLNQRKRELLEMSQPSTSKGAGDFSSGDDLLRMDKNRLMSPAPPKTDFQSKILSMIMPSNVSDNVNNSLQPNVHTDQALQVLSAANDSTMTALINFDNPTVKKALDNLIQSGPSILQNICAVTKNVNVSRQHLSTNTPLDRSQPSYNQYGIPISGDRPDPQMMSRMSGGRGGHSNVHPNMGMNAGRNIDPPGHIPHYNRGPDMFQNGPQMMNKGPPPDQMQRPHTDIHPQQY